MLLWNQNRFSNQVHLQKPTSLHAKQHLPKSSGLFTNESLTALTLYRETKIRIQSWLRNVQWPDYNRHRNTRGRNVHSRAEENVSSGCMTLWNDVIPESQSVTDERHRCCSCETIIQVDSVVWETVAHRGVLICTNRAVMVLGTGRQTHTVRVLKRDEVLFCIAYVTLSCFVKKVTEWQKSWWCDENRRNNKKLCTRQSGAYATLLCYVMTGWQIDKHFCWQISPILTVWSTQEHTVKSSCFRFD